MAAGDDNGRVTLAVLGEKLDNLDGKVTAALEDAKEERDAREKLGTRVTRIEERIGIWAIAQAAWTALASAIAAAIGVRK